MKRVLEALKAVAEETRLRLAVICDGHEFTVSELTRILGQSQPRVSRHLKLLCDAGVLERFREQNFVYYRISAKGQPGRLVERVLDLIEEENHMLQLDQLRVQEVLKARAIEAKQTLAHLPSDFHGFRAQKVDEKAVDEMILERTKGLFIGQLLDIGTGTGRMLRLLSSRTDHAVGIDISPQMLRLARFQLNQAGLGKFSVRYGDMYHLDFPNESFDTISIDHVLNDSEEPLRVLEEAGRLLREGGTLLIVQYQANTNGQECKNKVFQDRKGIRKHLVSLGMHLDVHETLPGKNGWVNLVLAKKMVSSSGKESVSKAG